MMTYKEAAAFVMPFGKYNGQALDRIAEKDDGLLFLDWLRGERQADERTAEYQTRLTEALCQYLDDPTIKSELAKASPSPSESMKPKRYR